MPRDPWTPTRPPLFRTEPLNTDEPKFDREILACNGGPNPAIRHEWISTLAPSVDPVRENEGASLPLKESDALERKLFRISWSSLQRMPYETVRLPSPHSLPRFIPT
jgi:hypothetical protein